MTTHFLAQRLRTTPDGPPAASGWSVGIDVGGTKTDAVIVTSGDRLVDQVTSPTAYGPEGVTATIAVLVDQLLARQSLTMSEIGAFGVGIPGSIGAETGVVRNAVNLGISTMPLREELEARFGRPVLVENDVNAAAIGAHRAMGLADHQSLALVNLGTGLAAGLVLGGRIWRGASGSAGEVGHIPLDEDSAIRCACGQRGCAELFASGGGIARRDHALLATQEPPAAGVASSTAVVLRSLALTLDVDVLALGGGLVAHTPGLIELVIQQLDEWAADSPLLRSYGLADRIVAVPTDRPIAALGAALLPTLTR